MFINIFQFYSFKINLKTGLQIFYNRLQTPFN